MKNYAIVLLAALTLSFAQAQNIDILLQNRQLVNREINCVLKRSPCDPIGKQITMLLPEAIFRDCRRCNSIQAANARKLIAFMKENHPDDFEQILKMYKPHN